MTKTEYKRKYLLYVSIADVITMLSGDDQLKTFDKLKEMEEELAAVPFYICEGCWRVFDEAFDGPYCLKCEHIRGNC